MTIQFRILLILVSFLTAGYILRKIRQAQMQIEDAIFLIFVPIILIVLSIVPSLAIVASKIIGIESPANFVFLSMIFILLIKVFTLSIKISQVEHKLETFIQEYAIDRKMSNNKEHPL